MDVFVLRNTGTGENEQQDNTAPLVIYSSFKWLEGDSTLIHSLQVVQEYERAVIFRLGRLLNGGAKGPGMLILILMLMQTFLMSQAVQAVQAALV